jgi:SAM-dependent methyltransferase
VSGTRPAAWDAEYRAGRYHGEPPVPFLRDVIAAAHTIGATCGLDVGCGNGRHLLPLLVAGVVMTGLDISAEAIAQLRARRPDRADRFVHGDLTVLPPEQRWPLMVGIQVFRHGDRRTAHAHVRSTAAGRGRWAAVCAGQRRRHRRVTRPRNHRTSTPDANSNTTGPQWTNDERRLIYVSAGQPPLDGARPKGLEPLTF